MLESLVDDAIFLKGLYDKVLRSSFSLFTCYDNLCMENYLHYGSTCCNAMVNIVEILSNNLQDNVEGLRYLAVWRENVELFYKKCDKNSKLGKEVACMHDELICLSKQMEEEVRKLYINSTSGLYTLPHRRISQLKNGVETARGYKPRKKLSSSTLRHTSTQTA